MAGCQRWATYSVDEGGFRAPAEGVAMGEGLMLHQSALCLHCRNDLLICCLHISAFKFDMIDFAA